MSRTNGHFCLYAFTVKTVIDISFSLTIRIQYESMLYALSFAPIAIEYTPFCLLSTYTVLLIQLKSKAPKRREEKEIFSKMAISRLFQIDCV